MRDSESETILAIPPVLGVVVVRVEPLIIVIAVRAEEVRIAIGICIKYHPHHTPRLLQELNFILHNNAPVFYTKYIHFL